MTTRKAKAMGRLVRSKITIPPKSKLMISHHSMGYLPALISVSLPQAVLKNWTVRRTLPMGITLKTTALGTVIALTSVTLFTMQS